MLLELDIKERMLLIGSLLARQDQLQDYIETFQKSDLPTREGLLKMWSEELENVSVLLDKVVKPSLTGTGA